MNPQRIMLSEKKRIPFLLHKILQMASQKWKTDSRLLEFKKGWMARKSGNMRDPCGDVTVLCLDYVSVSISMGLLQFYKTSPLRESG